MTGVLPLIIVAVFVAEMVALKWDRDDRTKQLDRLESEMKHLESRINAAEQAVDERQKQAPEKQRRRKKQNRRCATKNRAASTGSSRRSFSPEPVRIIRGAGCSPARSAVKGKPINNRGCRKSATDRFRFAS